MQIVAIDPREEAAQRLIRALDEDILARYPGLPTYGINAETFNAGGGYFTILSPANGQPPVACGAFRPVNRECIEIKRMFVVPAYRGKGHASAILVHLETVAHGRGFRGAILETGVQQPEAIALYRKSGYFEIPNYGEFATNHQSVCFAKTLV